MALPKEPRQKMINLMYLVLTALLALNVSAEILNAFKTVDNSLDRTNKTITASTSDIMGSLKDKLTDEKTAEKAKVWYPKAQEAERLSTDMYQYIDNLRNQILKAADFDPARKKGDSTFKEDNQDIPTRIMIKEGKGKELQQKLAAYREAMLKLDPVVAKEFSNSFQVDASMPKTNDKSNKTWEDAYFHMVPTVAAMTILRKFQNDVRTSENRVVGLLHNQVDKVAIRFNAYEAVVSQSSNYLMPGQELEIKAALAAFNSEKKPSISINGSGVGTDEKGMAVSKIQAGALGDHTVPVVVSFTDQDGNPQTRKFDVKYTVGQSNASIALDKMNVLYVGVANPVSVAASGGGDDKISIAVEGGGGTYKKTGAGKYDVIVTSPTEQCFISVLVDGKLAGKSLFRVRNIPAPTGTIGAFPSGETINVGAFKAQAGVGAFIKDFPFDIKYEVVSYSITLDNDEGDVETADCQGSFWSANARRIIDRNAKPQRMVTIDNLRARGPDGRTFKLGSLVYYLK